MNLQEQIAQGFAAISAKLAGGETQLSEANRKIIELTGERDGASTQLAAATAKATQLETELATANGTITTLRTEASAKDGQIADLKKTQTTAKEEGSKQAQQILAGQGLEAAQLPAGTPAAAGNVDQQVTALRAKLNDKSSSAADRFRISNQIRELLSPAAKTPNPAK